MKNKNKEPTVPLAFRIPVSQWQALRVEATLMRITPSDLMRRLVSRHTKRGAQLISLATSIPEEEYIPSGEDDEP